MLRQALNTRVPWVAPTIGRSVTQKTAERMWS